MRSNLGALALVLSLLGFGAAAAQSPGADPRRDQARGLVQAGRAAQALPHYDQLTQPVSRDLTLYAEAIRAAIAAGDPYRNALYRERQLRVDPDNYQVRQFVPVLYRTAGREADFERSRTELAAAWRASKDPAVRARTMFLIDDFEIASLHVFAMQCFEQAGDFGVGLRFDIFIKKDGPVGATDLRAFVAVEHNRKTAQMMKEMGQSDGTPRPTLDAFEGNGHATLQMFSEEPSYPTLKALVTKYVASKPALASAAPVGNTFAGVRCQTSATP